VHRHIDVKSPPTQVKARRDTRTHKAIETGGRSSLGPADALACLGVSGIESTAKCVSAN
jgi:hypothetical protein